MFIMHDRGNFAAEFCEPLREIRSARVGKAESKYTPYYAYLVILIHPSSFETRPNLTLCHTKNTHGEHGLGLTTRLTCLGQSACLLMCQKRILVFVYLIQER